MCAGALSVLLARVTNKTTSVWTCVFAKLGCRYRGEASKHFGSYMGSQIRLVWPHGDTLRLVDFF